jgi:hypothetical protein
MEVRALAETSVLDVNGSPSLLGEHWRRHAAVVVWLRHYGCMFCREQAAMMRAVAGDIEAGDHPPAATVVEALRQAVSAQTARSA